MWLMTRTIRPSTLRFFARPDAVRGLQVGFSAYHDLLAPASLPRIGETIFAAHAVLIAQSLNGSTKSCWCATLPTVSRAYSIPQGLHPALQTVRLVSALLPIPVCERF